MEDERELNWWPIKHEHYEDAVRLLARLNLTDEELHQLTFWASVPADMVKTPYFGPGQGHGIRLIDFNKLYSTLEQRANA